MTKRRIIVQTKEAATKYEVRIANSILDRSGATIRKAIDSNTRKAIVVSNKRVFGLYGARVLDSLSSAGFDASSTLIGDGEKFKNLKTLEKLLSALSSNAIERGDIVIALGGGVVGDIAGFAAAMHLRGVPFVQIPTTLLAMIDSSVGGKTGVNTSYGKNLVGAFYHPKSVLIDPSVLSTLPRREITAGLCEAVKQGAISGPTLFGDTVSVVDRVLGGKFRELSSDSRFQDPFAAFLANQIAFKAEIVLCDEREAAKNTSSRSRKILNFGHTFAHALEFATDYTYLKHGEAVGYGIIFAAELSKKLGLLDGNVVNLLCDVVHRTGNLPAIANIDKHRLFDAIRHDKKIIGGSLNWVLLKGIGKPVIVPHEKIGDKLVKEAIVRFTSN